MPRGRPKKPPAVPEKGVDLAAKAEELLSEEGYAKALACLYVRLTSGQLSRDETTGAVAARRVLESLRDLAKDREQSEQLESLKEQLRQTELTISRMQTGGTGRTSFAESQIQALIGMPEAKVDNEETN